MKKHMTKDDIWFKKTSDFESSLKIQCKHCGHKQVIPVFVDKLCCHWCGNYIFRNKKEEFKDSLRKRLNNENNRCN